MEYNWKKIKEQIITYCKVAFPECSINLTDEELEEDVIIFNNFINLPVSHLEIGSLRRNLTEALQKTCVEDIGNINDLQNISLFLDTFFKKLLPFIGKDAFANVKNDSQMALLKKTGLWGSPIPDFEKEDINKYRNNPNGMFILANSNLTRNALAHTSPAWDVSQVTYRLRYILALYIFVVHSFKSELLTNDSNLSKHDDQYFDENEEFALLYDYLSYGNSSVEIKKRYVSTYAKHQLYRLDSITESELIGKMKKFSDNSLDDYASKRIISEMEKIGEIELSSHTPRTYVLTDNEKKRIQEAEENYNNSLQRYNTSMQEILQKYGVTATVDEVNDYVMNHLESQYNYDIEEAIGDAGKAEKEDFKELIERLKKAGCPEAKGTDLYKEILAINRDNDIIVRISAGRSFQNISDPGKFDEYVRKADRDVWIDTQILLYILCNNENYQSYDHPFFKTAISLFKQPRANPYFHFKVAQFYRDEVRYQLRQALLLISVVDLPFAKDKKLSQNVFYRHYRYLHDNEGLPAGIETFSDYMEDNFNLYEEDAFDENYKTILNEVIKEKFGDYKITTKYIDPLNQSDISASELLFKQAAKDEGLTPKDGRPLYNDAFMGVFLFSNANEQKPIFLTLDNCFEPYRKLYVKKFVRAGAFNWHLFSPSAFVNHLDFINFRVNSDNLTDDLISMIETSEFKNKTLNVIDQFNRFLDIPQITSDQRKKYIKWVSNLFQSKEFSYKPEASNEEASPSIMRFLEAQDSVFNYFCDQEGDIVKDFQFMLQNETQFYNYISLLSDFAKSTEATKEDLFMTVEIRLEDYIKTTKDNSNSES